MHLFGYLFLTDYRPPSLQYCFFACTVALLTLLAWKIPCSAEGNGNLQVLKSNKLVIIGFLTALAFFLCFGVGPNLVTHPLILMVLGLILIFATFDLLKRYDWNEGTLYHKFTLVAGAVVFLIALTPFQELDKNRPDNPQGMLIVGISALIMLILLRRKLVRARSMHVH